MQKFLPFLNWMPNYKKSDFTSDLVAGLTVGIILIPQGMAYAMIAGLPPVYGLYASIVPVLIYMFLGTSKNIAIGPVAMDSLLVAAGLGALTISSVENYIVLAIFLGFLAGVFQLLLGVCRMGYLVNFLSKPVLSGFTSAAALIIVFSQIKHLIGVDIERSNMFHKMVMNVLVKIGETNLYDFLIGVVGILLLLAFNKWAKKIPSILIVVIVGILVVNFLKLDDYGVKILGEIPKGLPSFTVPDFNWKNTLEIWPIALTLAFVGYLEAISIGKTFEEQETKATLDANQELVALGASNIIGSFFQSYWATASFSRSAINHEAGVRTNLSGLFSLILVVLTLLFLTPLFYHLPKAILASIIMVSVVKLIDFKYAIKLLKNNSDEFLVLVLTFLITLLVGIPQGILSGVLFALLLMVYRTSNPHFAVIGNVKDTDYYKNVKRFADEVDIRDDLLIVRFDAQIYFGNVAYFRNKMQEQIALKGGKLKGIILNAESINYIDSGGAKMLTQLIKEVHANDIQFYIAGAIGPTRDIIFESGIIEELRKEFLFVKTKEAVAYFDNPKMVSIMGSKVAYQNKSKH